MTGESSPAITLEELTSGAVPSEVMRLYESAFPAHERLPIKDMLSWGKGYRLLDGGHFCGLAFVSVCGELVWLLFFAIVEELRSQGVGTRALAALEARYPMHRFIVDIEPEDTDAPNLAERRRRIAFWRRNSFQDAQLGFRWRGEQYAFQVKGGSLTFDEVRQFWRR